MIRLDCYLSELIELQGERERNQPPGELALFSCLVIRKLTGGEEENQNNTDRSIPGLVTGKPNRHDV